MPPGKQAIDGLWHCLCPAFNAQPLIQCLPVRRSQRLPRPWHTTVQRPAHRSFTGQSCRSAAEASSARKQTRQRRSFRSILPSSSDTPAAKHWNWKGTPIQALTNHDAYEALRNASTTGNYEMVQALLDVLIRERQEAPSPQLYLALIFANTSPNGSPEEVSKLLQEMEESGIVLDSAMYHAILKVLAMHPSYTFRSEILHEMLHQRWFTLSTDGWHDLVAGLIKDRQLEMALDKLEQMNLEGIRIQPWLHDMMVYILCEAEEIDEALKIMRQRTSNGEMMISATLWYSFLDAASRALHLEATLYVWRKRVESGYLNPPSGICLNVLASASRHGNFRLATDVFRILGNRSYAFQLHHHEALLEAYINGYDLKSALTLLCVMYSSGVPPTESSTRALFIYLRQKPFWPTKAFQILKELKDSKRDIPTLAVNCIIEACVHQNDLAQAIEHYKNLHTLCSAGPTTATFNVLLRGCSQAARKDLAMFLVSEMLALNVPPDALTYDRLILVCLDADAAYDTCNTDTECKDALRYLAEMKGMGWFPRRGTVVALVKRCCDVADHMAWELLGEMERRGMTVPGLEAWLEKNWTGDEDAKARRLAKMA